MDALLNSMTDEVVNTFTVLKYKLDQNSNDDTFKCKAIKQENVVKFEVNQIGTTDDYAFYDASVVLINNQGTFLLILSERTAEYIKKDTEDIKGLLVSFDKGNYALIKERFLRFFKRTYLVCTINEKKLYLLKIK